MTDQNQQPETDDNEYLQNAELRQILINSRQGLKDKPTFHGHTPFVPPRNEDGTYTLTHEQLAELINITHVRSNILDSRAVSATIQDMAGNGVEAERILANISWLTAVTTNENIDHMNACLADNPFPLVEDGPTDHDE